MQPEANRNHSILAALIALGGTLGALYLTLFPFDFFAREPVSLQTILARFDVNFISRYTVKDFPRNVLLFVPIGFGFYSLLAQRWSWLLRLVVIVLVGGVLSIAIEVGQIFLSGRFTAVADVVANTLGAVVGALLALVSADYVLKWVNALLVWFAQMLTPIRSATLLIMWVALVLIGLSAEQGRVRIDGWDFSAPLLVANETSGDRQWQGSVAGFYLAPYALDSAEIGQVFAGNEPATLTASPTSAHYLLTPTGVYRDSGGNRPDLIPQSQFDEAQWWRSAVAPVELSQAISAANAFTLVADVRSAAQEQSGPARIISLSTGIFERNLTLAQEGADLVVRMRNGVTDINGRYPALVIHDVFGDTRMHRIVVTYDNVTARIYIDDSAPAGMLRFTPALSLFLSRPPVDISEVYIESLQTWIYILLFTTLVYVPVGLLLSFIIPMRSAISINMLVLSSGSFITALLLEAGMAYVRGGDLDIPAVVLGVICGTATGGMMLYTNRQSSNTYDLASIEATQVEMQIN